MENPVEIQQFLSIFEKHAGKGEVTANRSAMGKRHDRNLCKVLYEEE